ncbi:MAG TPA: hypothetical protein VIK25_06010 [Gemmatimonadaceae bacterium]
MNFSRKLILVAGAALLAACGDKVTVAPPLAPVPPVTKINSVDVAPLTATITAGTTISYSVAVNADAGVAFTTAWTTSNSALTVDANGKIVTTATTAAGSYGVCAEATAGTQKVKGCATLVVTAPTSPTTNPATVSIQSITSGSLFTVVDQSNVSGQIDVTLNINPGNQVINKVELWVGNGASAILAGSQSFTAAQAAALRFSADQAVAAQTTFPQIVFSVNTACYEGLSTYCNALKGTTDLAGTPAWLNGTQAVQAKLYTTPITTPPVTAATASAVQTLTFNNVNTFVNNSTFYPIVTAGGATLNRANSTLGYQFTRGDITASIIPVSFTGDTLSSMSLNFGTAVCNALGTGPAQRTLVATAPVLPTGVQAWTATFAGTGTAAAGNISGYSYDPACASIATGEGISVIAAQTATGANFTTTALPINIGSQFRMDNLAPPAPAVFINPNGRANSWLNDAAQFTTIQAATNLDGMITAAVADVSVGGVTYAAKAGKTFTLAKAAGDNLTPIAPTRLDSTATNAGYCLLLYSQDKLGNRSADPASCATAASTSFGVDRAPPVILPDVGSLAANGRIATATIGGEWRVTVNDTGLVGNSGMLPTNPVLMSVSRRAAGTTGNSAGTTTLLAADGATTVTALSPSGVSAVGSVIVAGIPMYLYSTTLAGTTGATNYAYWTFNATARDAAGNTSTVTPRTSVFDFTAPIPGAPSAPLTITALGYAASALINEDLDIQDYGFNGTYTGAPVIAPATLGMPWVSVNGFNAPTFSNTNFLVTTGVTLPMAIQANMAAGLTNIANLSTISRSQSNLAAVSGTTAFATVTPGAAITFTGMTAFTAATLAGVTGIVTGNATGAGAGNAASAALTVTGTGSTATFNNPFTRVDFYMLDASGLRYMLVGSATSPVLNDNGAVRTFTWTATVNGSTIYSILNGAGAGWASQIVALGMNASGQVGMVNAALTPVNVVF